MTSLQCAANHTGDVTAKHNSSPVKAEVERIPYKSELRMLTLSRRDSSSQPLDHESSALPTSYPGSVTFCLVCRCPKSLSLSPFSVIPGSVIVPLFLGVFPEACLILFNPSSRGVSALSQEFLSAIPKAFFQKPVVTNVPWSLCLLTAVIFEEK